MAFRIGDEDGLPLVLILSFLKDVLDQDIFFIVNNKIFFHFLFFFNSWAHGHAVFFSCARSIASPEIKCHPPSQDLLLHFRPALDRLGNRDLIGVIQIGTDRQCRAIREILILY